MNRYLKSDLFKNIKDLQLLEFVCCLYGEHLQIPLSHHYARLEHRPWHHVAAPKSLTYLRPIFFFGTEMRTLK